MELEIRWDEEPIALHQARHKFNWATAGTKEIGNNLLEHKLHVWDGNVNRLVAINPDSITETGEIPCSQATPWAHICVPTSEGQSRCQDGYLLLPDSKNCTLPRTDKVRTVIIVAGVV